MKRFYLLVIPILFAALLFGVTQQTLQARSNGYSGRTQMGCISCHQGGTAPLVALTGARNVTPNSTTTYQLLITSTTPLSQTHAGFDLTILDTNGAQVGTLETSDPDAQISDVFSNGSVEGELIHSQPKQNVNGVATVEFQWTAPITHGVYTVYFVGNSVDRNSGPSGDAWMTGSADIRVGPNLAVSMRDASVSADANMQLVLIPLFSLLIGASYFILKQKRQP